MSMPQLPLFPGIPPPARPLIAYRVRGAHYRPGSISMTEWHTTLASALQGLAEAQQRPWDVVSLWPVFGEGTP